MKRTHPKLRTAQADHSGIPRELMTVSQLAAAANEPPHAVRYYSRIGILETTALSSGGYKLFDRSVLNRLRFIRLAQGLGFTLEEIQGFLRHASKGAEPCPQVKAILDQRLPQIGSELTQLQALHARMTLAQKRWSRIGGGIPTGYEICRLIESEAEEATSVRPLRKRPVRR